MFEYVKKRNDICGKCEHKILLEDKIISHLKPSCGVCGCSLYLLTRQPLKLCKLGKWDIEPVDEPKDGK